jgi:leucyl/phenylalanyl-tRNA--protein transferase
MTLLTWLDPNNISFPNTTQALTTPNGLLAAGGQLSSQWLLHAYSRGIFPWFMQGEPILWWSPSPRTIIEINHLHISRSLAKTLRKKQFTVTFDQAFEHVIEACAEPRTSQDDGETWISKDMMTAYCQLHHLGYAHSVEVWQQKELIGGIYGISLGRMFFGESMFSRAKDGSKIALFHLVEQIKKWQYIAIDCQVYNPHLERMGAVQISRATFESMLSQHVNQVPCHWNPSPTHPAPNEYK